ncbi:MAG: hypothetical protein HGB34_04290 [Candidatus Moranbacteria bacterium]|nr:hypothetical protein [Candidatus Moranbacteria bacterium]
MKMDERYCTKAMTSIWSYENKFLSWLLVEFAILRAKRRLKEISVKVPRRTDFVKIDVVEIS